MPPPQNNTWSVQTLTAPISSSYRLKPPTHHPNLPSPSLPPPQNNTWSVQTLTAPISSSYRWKPPTHHRNPPPPSLPPSQNNTWSVQTLAAPISSSYRLKPPTHHPNPPSPSLPPPQNNTWSVQTLTAPISSSYRWKPPTHHPNPPPPSLPPPQNNTCSNFNEINDLTKLGSVYTVADMATFSEINENPTVVSAPQGRGDCSCFAEGALEILRYDFCMHHYDGDVKDLSLDFTFTEELLGKQHEIVSAVCLKTASCIKQI